MTTIMPGPSQAPASSWVKDAVALEKENQALKVALAFAERKYAVAHEEMIKAQDCCNLIRSMYQGMLEYWQNKHATASHMLCALIARRPRKYLAEKQIAKRWRILCNRIRHLIKHWSFSDLTADSFSFLVEKVHRC